VNIGWKLAAVTQGWGGAGLLRSYEAERRGVAQRTIDATTLNMRAMMDLRLADASAIQRGMKGEFHSLGLVLGNDYSGSSPQADEDLTRHTPSTRPGRRLPHVWLSDGRSIYDTLGTGLTLLRRAEGFSDFVDHAHRRGIPLTTGELPPSGVYEDADALLVRPDQYIAWRGSEPSSYRADVVLDRVLGHC